MNITYFHVIINLNIIKHKHPTNPSVPTNRFCTIGWERAYLHLCLNPCRSCRTLEVFPASVKWYGTISTQISTWYDSYRRHAVLRKKRKGMEVLSATHTDPHTRWVHSTIAHLSDRVLIFPFLFLCLKFAWLATRGAPKQRFSECPQRQIVDLFRPHDTYGKSSSSP